MKLRSLQGWVPLFASLLSIGLAFDVLTRSRLSAMTAPLCEGEYADTLEARSLRSREIDHGPRSQFSYLVRSSAKYECPFFGPDGKLRRRHVQASELGSAFAYEQTGGDTYLLTNEHVASWPDVTDTVHRIDGVPDGCKRVEDKLRIVKDERDDFEPGQTVLTRIAVDPLLDAAILKANQKLTTIPFAVGKSAGLRQGNVVEVRGFPLGVMQAVSSGKVVNPYDRDQEQGWDHVDFVIDALLSEGNSGSPVLAVSCKTRQMELVGIYHAGYKGHNALNVVVGIDQLTEFMKKKKRVPRALSPDAASTLGVAERTRAREALGAGTLPLFDFGGLVVQADVADDALLYQVYSRQFPLDDRRVVVIEDKPGAKGVDEFGELGRLWVLSPTGWREWPQAALGADEHDLFMRVADSIRMQLVHTIGYRHTLANPNSADERKRGRDLSRALQTDVPVARDLASNLLETAERLSSSTTPSASASDSPVNASALPPKGAPAP
jgi:S1-C subfamily serine protease